MAQAFGMGPRAGMTCPRIDGHAPNTPCALPLLQAFHGQLTRGEVDFATLASKESHCSSAQRGGDLGVFGWVRWWGRS